MFKTLTDTTSMLGECPLWCERTERLFWTDIPSCELRALDPVSGEVQRWPLPESLGSFALTADEDVLPMVCTCSLASIVLNTKLPIRSQRPSLIRVPGTPGVTAILLKRPVLS